MLMKQVCHDEPAVATITVLEVTKGSPRSGKGLTTVVSISMARLGLQQFPSFGS
jgi:hypothetical protein